MLLAAPVCVSAQDVDVDEEANDDEVILVTRVAKTKKVEPTRTIQGRVLSQASKQPLAGVLIQSVAGEGYSTLSEDNGSFTMQVPLYCSAITVSIPGYNMARVGLNESGQLRDIIMQDESAKALYTEDDNILNKVWATDLGYSATRNVTNEIQDQLGSYVHAITRNGVSGIGSYMNIGGVNSLSSNSEPMIIVDGNILDQHYEQNMIHSGFYNDFLTNVNVNDIESVEVMPNGTSLYGAKGANGVIYIKTKRSKSQATRIDAIANVGFEMMPKLYPVMNGPQYKNYASGLLQSTGTNINIFKFLNADPNYYWYNKYNNDTDWSKEVYQNAVVQNYGLSIQGGGEVAGYMLSVGYTMDNSVLKENNFNRLNIRFNTDIKITNALSLKFDAAYANQTRRLLDNGAPEGYDAKSITSTSFLALAKSPMLSPFTYAGEITQDPITGQISGIGQVYNAHLDIVDEDYLDEVNVLRDANYRLANPLAINHYGSDQTKNYFDNNYINLTVTPRYDFNKHLSLSSLFSMSIVNTNERYYVPMNGVPSYYVAELQGTRQNQMESLASRQTTVNSDSKLNWHNSYDAHNINLTGGFRYISEIYNLSTQKGYNTGNDKTVSIGSTVDKLAGGTDKNLATLTWYGQAQYNYANRYYLDANMAVETNSQFGKDAKSGFKLFGARWAVFPSVQAGWVLTNEKWFDVKGIDYVKLTAGFGASGNDNISYDANRTYFSSALFMNGVAGLFLNNIGNTELQWETTKRFNAGLQVNALNNRLGVHFNYFHSWTDNLLTLRELGFISGLDYNWSNGGSLKNQGFDAGITAHLVSHKDWNWSVGATVGHYVNTLTALPDGNPYWDTEILGATIRSEVGGSLNNFYGYRTKGVFSTSEENSPLLHEDALYFCDNTGAKTYFEAGDMIFEDVNPYNARGEYAPGQIDEADRVILGTSNPDLYGNISTNLSWKNLSLDCRFNYSLGNEAFNYMRQQLESGSRFMNQTTSMMNRWTNEGMITNMPKATYGDPMGNSRFSDRWIEDASYLKLKTVTLSYKIPINNIYIQGLSVWAQANNLFTLTKYIGTDPEFSMGNGVLQQGIDCGLLSQGRNFHIGVKINL